MYTIYLITNTINGRYYVGSHITDNLNDGYMGSGKLIEQAIRKYGRKSFTKEIVCCAKDIDTMKWLEQALVITNNIDPKSYNLVPGGGRPPSHKGVAKTALHKKRIGASNKGNKRPDMTEFNRLHRANLVKGTKWANNGMIEIQVKPGNQLPNGFSWGRV